VTAEDARSLALSLPDAVEQDHHGRPSFRVATKIFATLWSDVQMNVMLDEGGIKTALERWPESCEELYWGKRLAGVRVDLLKTDESQLRELLGDAWELKTGRPLEP
jgi:hypothetical protein